MAPAPGWYPDASYPHLLRWWDGEQWTDKTMPLKELPAPHHRHSTDAISARLALLMGLLGGVVISGLIVLFFLVNAQ